MKGIIFNAEMVRAILEGRKTVTRRPVKKQPEFGIMECPYCGFGLMNKDGGCNCRPVKAPYSHYPSETVYVKETWKPGVCNQTSVYIEYKAGGTEWPTNMPAGIADKIRLQSPLWRPSILMPEWASRIKLEIVSVRAERLQEITNRDCIAEGWPIPNIKDYAADDILKEIRESEVPCFAAASLIKSVGISPKEWFQGLWDSIYRDKCPWDSNCWIWRIEFKKTTT